jgi:hypothetical protein
MRQTLTEEIQSIMPDAVATGMFTSVATFYDRSGAVDPDTGQLDQTNLVAVSGLSNIACMIAPMMTANAPMPQGFRAAQGYAEEPQRHILLDDYYPAVLQRYIVEVDGVQYAITPGGVEYDSQKQMTRLAARVYTI